jgi:hypothetical protein
MPVTSAQARVAVPLALFALVGACAPPSAPPYSCGIAPETRLTETGIGDLQVGRPVAEVAERCHVLSDTTEIRQEGQPARIVTVDLGRDTVEAEAVDARIWRITLDRPAFRTADSLGVGTPLSRLLQYEGVRGMPGEDGLYVRMPVHCGLSFRLSGSGHGSASEWTPERLARLPGETHVGRVLVVGCAP